MGWKLYQLAVLLFFLFGNVYWEWGGQPLAVGVLGGIAAWYSSAILFYLYEKMFVPEAERLTPPANAPRYGGLEAFNKKNRS